MIIGHDHRLKKLNYKNYEIWWNGFIYIPKFPNGEKSIQRFLDDSLENNFTKTCQLLQGQFLLIIKNNMTNEQWGFVDNSGMHYAFQSENCLYR